MPSLPAIACPTCDERYVPRRTNQRYCKRVCQKNAKRGPQATEESSEARRRAMMHNDLARRLAERLYSMPPMERLGFISEVVETARSASGPLRNVLTDTRLLRAKPEDKRLFYRRSPQVYRTIAQVGDIYCRTFWGKGVATVVHGRCPEPKTGEVLGPFAGQSASAHVMVQRVRKTEAPECHQHIDSETFLGRQKAKRGTQAEPLTSHRAKSPRRVKAIDHNPPLHT